MADSNTELRARIVALAHRHHQYGAGMMSDRTGPMRCGPPISCLIARPMAGLKCLAIVDDATTEAVAVVPTRALGGLPVTRVLDRLAVERGLPQILRADYGLEFCGGGMLTWAHARGVTLRLIEPGKPIRTPVSNPMYHVATLR